MKKLEVAFAKLVMALHRQNVNIDGEDAIAYFKYNSFDIKMLDEENKEFVIVSKEDINNIMNELVAGVSIRTVTKEIPVGLVVGDEIEVLYKGELKVGKIKVVSYQVEGIGNKNFPEAEVTKK
jgi:hypothetical protein